MLRTLFVSALVIASLSTRLAAYQLRQIDRMDGGRRMRLSANGQFVVGADLDLGYRDAVMWSPNTGTVSLGIFPGYSVSVASDVSADGSVVAGYANETPTKAFRWTAADGLIGLGDLPPSSESSALAISENGSTIVGRAGSFPNTRPFLWRQGLGMIGLGLPAGYGAAEAVDVSADGGTVAVAAYDHANSITRPFLWDSSNGFQDLGPLPGGHSPGSPAVFEISQDGSTLLVTGGGEAYLWSAGNGYETLPKLNGAGAVRGVPAINADASVVVGNYAASSFVWDMANGVRDLKQVLATEHGFSQADLFFEYVRDISDDGTALLIQQVAADTSPAWVIYLDKPLVTPVPEPGSCVCVLAGILIATAFERRRYK